MVKPEGERALGRDRHRWEDNIKMGLKEVGLGAWIELSWLRLGIGGGRLGCGDEPLGSIKCGKFYD